MNNAQAVIAIVALNWAFGWNWSGRGSTEDVQHLVPSSAPRVFVALLERALIALCSRQRRDSASTCVAI